MRRQGQLVLVDPTSHHQALRDALNSTTGPVLELGCGNSSTRFLHDLCVPANRFLLSLDNNPEWSSQFADLDNHYHEVRLTNDYLRDKWTNREWSVALVDLAPRQLRVPVIQRLAFSCGRIVIHDTDCWHYGYGPTLMGFRWRKDYRDKLPFTTVVSNRQAIT